MGKESSDKEFRYDCLVRMIAAERDHYKEWCNISTFVIALQWILLACGFLAHPAPAKDPLCQDIESKYQKIIQHDGAGAGVDYYPPTEDGE